MVPQERHVNTVNIGVVTYNRLAFTRQVIDHLLAHTDHPHMLSVVDNGSVDGTPEYLSALKSRGAIKNLVLLGSNAGVARASNIAWLLEPGAAYYLKLDNDMLMKKKGWLSDMVRVAERIGRIGVLAYNVEPKSFPRVVQQGVTFRVKTDGNVGGACVLIPRSTCLKLGFWSEEYGLYGEEDADYGARVSRGGLWNAYMDDEEAAFHLPAGRAGAIEEVTYRTQDGIEEKLETEYRNFKDALRKSNWDKGPFRDNLQRYAKGHKSLFAVPGHALEWLKKNDPGAYAKTVALPWFDNGTVHLPGCYCAGFARHPLARLLLGIAAGKRHHPNPLTRTNG